MKRVAIGISLAALVSLAAACKSSEPEALPPDQAADLLVNRNWLDRMPESRDDKLHVYRFTPAMGGGVYQDRTLFKGTFELFTFEVEGDRLRIVWPHRELKEEIRFRIERIDGPRPFDLRLRLDGNSTGPSVLYGMSREGHELSELSLP
jgi:hypothetical protein